MQGQPSPIPSPGWPRLPPLQGCYFCIAFEKTQPDQQSEGSSTNRKAVFSHQAEISGATGHCSLHSLSQHANHMTEGVSEGRAGFTPSAALNNEMVKVHPSASQAPHSRELISHGILLMVPPQVRPAIV